MEEDLFIRSSIDVLKLATPKITQGLAKNVGTRLLDIALHVPTRIRTIYHAATLNPALEGKHVALSGVVEGHLPPRQPRSPYQISFSIGPQKVFLTFFNGHPSMFTRTFVLKKKMTIVGVLRWKEQWQIAHPTIIPSPLTSQTLFQPLYPLPDSIHQQRYRAVVDELLAVLPNMPEWIPINVMQEHNWPSWKDALIQAHKPRSEQGVDPTSPAKCRLAFDELLAHNLSIGLLTYHQQEQRKAHALAPDEKFFSTFAELLPFSLTTCQKDACQTIYNDMLRSRPMLRLLQGDVGSGKTAVGFFAMLLATNQGQQAVLLSPTEILIQQQYKALIPLATALGKNCGILTSQTTRKERTELLAKVHAGDIDLLLGTHAVLEKDVRFKALNLVIIDEQHRFGVQQRLSIVDKGLAPHTLIMSATPIPRSLTLTLFGSVHVSRLTTRPKPFLVETKAIAQSHIKDLYAKVLEALQQNQRIFWICPLIEESETLNLTPVTKRFEELQNTFPDVHMKLLHGRMKGAEKNDVLDAFRRGDVLLLVTTTVVEVGVDIPECNFMVIENAEFFGLAQIHQLRGRVGRKGEKASCFLLYQPPLTPTAEKRLATIQAEPDGFKIAEQDLQLRGSGDVLGIKQSGLPPFQIADLVAHHDLYTQAQHVAKSIVETNPFLEGKQGTRLRTLLRLLKGDSLSYIHSG